ncbi:dihydroxyacetone kinase subunit DhaK [Brevifollis gellanilyticus]|uniref:Dihydroxyacetone kinase subunit DhaK n=2 Tax=Brevifollis gellanilyticus TaxID=748831 RepID=A0A512M374_9BACT|nr:dihydroxyacetone kinase subunit DhaK [Brevifollis gellanilyticus]
MKAGVIPVPHSRWLSGLILTGEGAPAKPHARIPTRPDLAMSKNSAKKIINDPLKCADELFEGLVLAYDGKVRRVGKRSLVMNDLRPDAPALLVGGGAGHEPIYHGLVGKGMADGAAVGEIFAAPPPDIVLEATQAVNRGKGVLFLYGNYAGDVMNFDIGGELAADEGITVKTVIINDDVCSAPPDKKQNRRGVGGLVPITKLAGAAATVVDSLDELVRIAQKAVDNTRTVGVSTKPGSIPATGEPTFELADDVIGLGMGIHGEKGVGLIPMCTADELAAKILDLLFADDMPLNAGDEIVFFVNSLGSTHMMELLILLRAARPILDARGIKVHHTIVDSIVTCQEMAGVSFSITKLDAELKKLWDLPCESVGYTKL